MAKGDGGGGAPPGVAWADAARELLPDGWRARRDAIPAKQAAAEWHDRHGHPGEAQRGGVIVRRLRGPAAIRDALEAEAAREDAADLRRALAAGELVAWGREGSMIGVWRAVPPDAWPSASVRPAPDGPGRTRHDARLAGGVLLFGLRVALPVAHAGRHTMKAEADALRWLVAEVPHHPERHKAAWCDAVRKAFPTVTRRGFADRIWPKAVEKHPSLSAPGAPPRPRDGGERGAADGRAAGATGRRAKEPVPTG